MVKSLCKEIKRKRVKVAWGIETRLDLLDKDIIEIMYNAGLKNINIGIETIDPIVAKRNKRKLINLRHQEEIIAYCKEIGVNISAFYIIGYEGDTERTISYTINYAISLNTPLARFAISTPYPGTGYYEQLEKDEKIISNDFEEYNQFNLVFKHENFSKEELQKLLEKAYKKYYFRISYIKNLINY